MNMGKMKAIIAAVRYKVETQSLPKRMSAGDIKALYDEAAANLSITCSEDEESECIKALNWYYLV